MRPTVPPGAAFRTCRRTLCRASLTYPPGGRAEATHRIRGLLGDHLTDRAGRCRGRRPRWGSAGPCGGRPCRCRCGATRPEVRPAAAASSTRVTMPVTRHQAIRSKLEPRSSCWPTSMPDRCTHSAARQDRMPPSMPSAAVSHPRFRGVRLLADPGIGGCEGLVGPGPCRCPGTIDGGLARVPAKLG
jgi:hypothetical protein